MKKNSIWALLASVVLAEGLGFLSSMLSGDIAGKYLALNKPPLSPPGGVFGIVWIVIYLLMAIAAYLVFASDSPERRTALTLYAGQLLLNLAWSPIFFGAGQLWVAFAVIIAMDILVVITALRFARINKVAGWLMVPYVLWLLFATYLNVGCAILN